MPNPKPHPRDRHRRPAARSGTPPPPGPRTDWGPVAQWYDQLVGEGGSEFHREVVLPGVVRLLGLSAGQRALDVACGQGVLCRVLHAAGVGVTGVDASKQLIRLAQERSDKAIEYVVGDARELAMLPAGQFDAAACVLSIQNIQPIQPVFEGVARALRSGGGGERENEAGGGGRFVIAMMHPAFRGPKATHWGWDDQAKVQYRRVDRYLLPRKEPIVTHPGKDPGRFTWTFHRPLQAYVKALARAGLMIDALEEWPSHKVSDSGPRAPAENAARKEIPMFMAIRAVKMRAPQATTGDAGAGE